MSNQTYMKPQDLQSYLSFGNNAQDNFAFFEHEIKDDYSEFISFVNSDSYVIIEHSDDEPEHLQNIQHSKKKLQYQIDFMQLEKKDSREKQDCEATEEFQQKIQQQNSIIKEIAVVKTNCTNRKIFDKKSTESLSDVNNDASNKENMKNTKSFKKTGRRPENLGLTKRKDVIIKTLLRKMKKYFWRDFTSFSGLKSKGDPNAAFSFGQSLLKYSNEKLNFNESNGCLFFLSSLMSPKYTGDLLSREDFFRNLKNNLQTQNKLKMIHDVLYKFTYSQFKKLLRNKEA
jgi:hypothetical protein